MAGRLSGDALRVLRVAWNWPGFALSSLSRGARSVYRVVTISPFGSGISACYQPFPVPIMTAGWSSRNRLRRSTWSGSSGTIRSAGRLMPLNAAHSSTSLPPGVAGTCPATRLGRVGDEAREGGQGRPVRCEGRQPLRRCGAGNPLRKCESDYACAAREGPWLRRRRAMLTV